jgi:hypothetical protein
MEALLAGLCKQAVDEREVILSFSRFDEFPGDGRQDGIEWDGREARPKRLHVFQAGGTGIVKLAGEHQKGFAIHNELRRDATFFQAWKVYVLRAGRDRGKKERRNGYGDRRQESDSHGGRHSAKSPQDLSIGGSRPALSATGAQRVSTQSRGMWRS